MHEVQLSAGDSGIRPEAAPAPVPPGRDEPEARRDDQHLYDCSGCAIALKRPEAPCGVVFITSACLNAGLVAVFPDALGTQGSEEIECLNGRLPGRFALLTKGS